MPKGKALNGAVIAISGTLSKPRKEVEADIAAAGGKAGSSVTATTTLLVTTDAEYASVTSKVAAAKARGIPCVCESYLRACLAKGSLASTGPHLVTGSRPATAGTKRKAVAPGGRPKAAKAAPAPAKLSATRSFSSSQKVEFMAYSRALDCLILGNHDHHTNLFALDMATLSLRAVKGLGALETPFPGGCIAIGETASDRESIFVSEHRYDHILGAGIQGGGIQWGGCIGAEGELTMTGPMQMCFDGAVDELWVAREQHHPRFVCVLRGSTGKKVGVISPTALWGPGQDSQYFVRHIAGLALSDEEVFVATEHGVKVFSRGQRESAVWPPMPAGEPGTEVGEESKQGYVYRRELKVNKRIDHVAGWNGQLVLCCEDAVRILNSTGKELCKLPQRGAKCAAICGRADGDELAVLVGNGNIHFYK
jgi:hypothetical protein